MVSKMNSENINSSDSPDEKFIDDDEDTRSGSGIKPWDPSKIRITTKHLSLKDVVDQIREKEIDLAPDFQRAYVWKPLQRTRLIESVLLGIPLPAFYFNQDKSGLYQVVDGVQRLSTIAKFMSDEHILHAPDLAYLKRLDGRTYSNLDPADSRRLRSTQIIAHVIEPQTPDELKYDIFSRVNTLGTPLSAQEIRHAMSKSRSRTFLRELSELESFDQATEWKFWKKPDNEAVGLQRDSARMANRELALRFCAFFDFSVEAYKQHESLDTYLIEFTHRIDGTSESSIALSDEELVRLKDTFSLAMLNSYSVLGNSAFRKWAPNKSRRGPINRAVFESQALALSRYPTNRLLERKDEIQMEFRNAFLNERYVDAVSVGTGSFTNIDLRLRKTREILERIMR